MYIIVLGERQAHRTRVEGAEFREILPVMLVQALQGSFDFVYHCVSRCSLKQVAIQGNHKGFIANPKGRYGVTKRYFWFDHIGNKAIRQAGGNPENVEISLD